MKQSADQVFRNGRVYSIDSRNSIHEAIAVTNGVITFIGSDENAGQWIGDCTEVIDLGGRTILPGFSDSHIHPPGIADQSLSDSQKYQTAKCFQELMTSYGYTSILALRPPKTVGQRTTDFDLFKMLEERGELHLRVHGAVNMSAKQDIDLQLAEMKSLKTHVDTDLIQFTTAKFFLDGVIEGTTGYLLEPYEEAAGKGSDFKGSLLWPEEKLAYAFRRCIEEGFQIHCHSIGDGATHAALIALEEALAKAPSSDHRTILTHLQLVSPDDIKKMATLGVTACLQPYWHFKSPAFWWCFEEPLIGLRADLEYPLQSLLREGVLITASSDYPASQDPNPFYAIKAGMTRNIYNASSFNLEDIKDMDDPIHLLNKNERASALDLIKAFTVNAAFGRHQEALIGTLEPDKSADFIAIDRDPFAIDPLDFENIKVVRTVFKGQTVFSRP